MRQLPWIDIAILVIYVGTVVGVGSFFVRSSKTVKQFTAAGGNVPGWAVGLSLFGTFLSSMTFGVKGPTAAPGTPSCSTSRSRSPPLSPRSISSPSIAPPANLRLHPPRARFGSWATPTPCSATLNQVARIGAILLGVALVLHTLIGWDIATTILVTGALVTIYTMLGGIEAVVWTDVVQSIVLLSGAAFALIVLLFGMPEGPGQILAIASEHGKMSLGSWGPSIGESTVWVVLVYGIAINLNNFGIDQDQVQRYHVAKSEREASAPYGPGLPLRARVVHVLSDRTSSSRTHQVTPKCSPGADAVAAANLKLDLAAATADQRAAIRPPPPLLGPADIGDKVFRTSS